MDMKNTFDKLGIKTEGLHLSFGELKKLNGDLICHYKEGHFVVIEEIGEDFVTIFDPPKKLSIISIKDFLTNWDGNVIVVDYGGKVIDFNETYLGPRFFTDIEEYDWGVKSEDDYIEYDFDFYNLGNDILKIDKFVSSCNCVEAEVDKPELLPMDVGKIKMIIDTSGYVGRNINKALIRTNDDKCSEILFQLVGEIRRPLDYNPKIVDVGIIKPKQSKIRRITFTGAAENALDIANVDTSRENIRVIRVIDYNKDPYIRIIELEVSWIESTGSFQEFINVFFTSDNFVPVRVDIIGEYQEDIQVDPSGIFLSSNPSNTVIKGSINLMSLSKRKFLLKSVATDISFLDLTIPKENNNFEFIIDYKGRIPLNLKDGFLGNINITTEISRQNIIEVPVFLIN
jgi:hypothetical protein